MTSGITANASSRRARAFAGSTVAGGAYSCTYTHRCGPPGSFHVRRAPGRDRPRTRTPACPRRRRGNTRCLRLRPCAEIGGFLRRRFANIAAPGRARAPRRVELGQRAGRAFRREMLRRDVETQQPAFDRTVEHSVRALRLQPELEAERRVAGQHRRVPAAITLAQRAAELRVQRRELAHVAQPLAVRRIHGDEAALDRRRGQIVERERVARLCTREALAAAALAGAARTRPRRGRSPRIVTCAVRRTRRAALSAPRPATFATLGIVAAPTAGSRSRRAVSPARCRPRSARPR